MNIIEGSQIFRTYFAQIAHNHVGELNGLAIVQKLVSDILLSYNCSQFFQFCLDVVHHTLNLEKKILVQLKNVQDFRNLTWTSPLDSGQADTDLIATDSFKVSMYFALFAST